MNKKGVSAVMGVILMVAITVAIAATVYLYISGFFGGGITPYEEKIVYVRGNVTRIEKIINYWDTDYNITFDYNNTYRISNNENIWEIGNYYELTLSYNKYGNDYDITEYVILIDEIKQEV